MIKFMMITGTYEIHFLENSARFDNINIHVHAVIRVCSLFISFLR